MKLIDKNKLLEELKELKENLSASPIVVINDVESLVESLETKEVDLEKEITHYLLYEHRSPLNEIMHKADIKAEMQYHKDIENAFKAGFELGLRAKDVDEIIKTAEDHAYFAGSENTREKLIDKACEWLKTYRQDTPDGTGYIAGIVNDKTIEDFRKAMEE